MFSCNGLNHNNMKRFIVIICICSSIFSCKKTRLESELSGIWIGARQNYLFDTTKSVNNSLQQGYPILVDIQKNNSLILKIFNHNEKKLYWSVSRDSIFQMDQYKYKLKYISPDSLVFLPNQDNVHSAFTLFRIYNNPIKLDSSKIVNILTHKIWSISKINPQFNNNPKIFENIEYLPDNVRLLKYKSPNSRYDSAGNTDSIIWVQLDMWSLGCYKNNYFISENRDGENEIINNTIPATYFSQIADISDSYFSLYSMNLKNDKISYYGYDPIKNNKMIQNDLIGKWTSMNLKNNSYGYYSKRKPNTKFLDYYEGNITFDFKQNKLLIYGEKTDTMEYKWFVSKGCNTVIYEYLQNDPDYNSETVFFTEILDVSSDNLTLDLNFNNYVPSGLIEPRKYILHRIQHFKRLK